MSPTEVARRTVNKVTNPSPLDLLAHATVLLTIIICTTILGDNHTLNSGDVLAVFTGCITGTATVAGARAGNRRFRSGDEPDTE